MSDYDAQYVLIPRNDLEALEALVARYAADLRAIGLIALDELMTRKENHHAQKNIASRTETHRDPKTPRRHHHLRTTRKSETAKTQTAEY